MNQLLQFIRNYPLSLLALLLIAVFLYIKPIPSTALAGVSNIISSTESFITLLLQGKGSLIDDNERLQNENAALRSLIIDDFSSDIELNLQDRIDELSIDGYSNIPVNVIGASQFNEHIIIVDSGNFSTGDLVIDAYRNVIGEVTKVGESTALVRLTFSQDSSYLSRLARPDTVEFLIEGTGFFDLSAQFIGKASSIELEDLVVTSGTQPGIPLGLVLGRVTDVENVESNPFIEAKISPLFRKMDLSTVIVLRADYEGL
jgi:cell shape-determining protein MreC